MTACGQGPPRIAVIVWLATGTAATACATAAMPARSADGSAETRPDGDQGVELGARQDVAAARELDHEGVRSFREGRYGDAVRYFRAAYRLGGPSSELWNIARSRERVDDPEGAAAAIAEYLARRDLSPSDRADADRELRALRGRPSVLTVTSIPPGAIVMVDGRQAPGVTPLTVEIPAGAHSVTVRRDGLTARTLPVEARFGRALVVALDLAGAGK